MTSIPPNTDHICRLVPDDEWHRSQQQRRVVWRADDKKSGFLHLSAPHQLLKTAARHFNEADQLMVLIFEKAALGDHLKWELAPKRGEKFPHYYGDLTTDHVVATGSLIRRASGWRWREITKEAGEDNETA